MSRACSAVVLLCALAACGAPAPPTPPPPKVTVVQPVVRDIIEWDDYTARLEAVDSVEVRPRVSGYLQAIHFQDGGLVKKGDLLFSIDPRPYDAALRRAQADVELARSRLELARKNFARAARLLASHAISQEESDIRQSNVRQAEAAVEEAQAAVDAAKLDVEFTQVRAPGRGRLLAGYRVAGAAWDEAVARYQQTAVQAFAEVSNALVAHQKLKGVHSARAETVEALQTSVALSLERYTDGIANYFEVLEAEQQLFPAELDLARTQRDELLAVVALYRALGGGWELDGAGDNTVSASARPR